MPEENYIFQQKVEKQEHSQNLITIMDGFRHQRYINSQTSLSSHQHSSQLNNLDMLRNQRVQIQYKDIHNRSFH